MKKEKQAIPNCRNSSKI